MLNRSVLLSVCQTGIYRENELWGRMLTAMRELLPAEQRKTRRALLPVKQRKKSRQEQALPGKELSIPAAIRKNQLY